MFPRRIGNKTKFYPPAPTPSFFFPGESFRGQFSQEDPIIILQRRLPPPNPMGGLSEGKTKRKRKGNGGVVMMRGGYTSGNKCWTKRHGTRSQTALWCHLFPAQLKQKWGNYKTSFKGLKGLKSKPDVASCTLKLKLKGRIMTNPLQGRFHGHSPLT